MFFQFILVFLCIIFTACESKVQFLIEGDDCITKTVRGKEVCVQKKTQMFRVAGLKDHPVDFIFVLDVSDSMQDDLARIGKAFVPLISQIQETDWHILFTTADHGDHHFSESKETGKKTFTNQQWRDYTGDKPYFGQFMPLEHQGSLLLEKQLSKAVPQYQEVFRDTLTRNFEDSCHLPPFCQEGMEQPLRALNASIERLADSPSLLHSSGDIIAFLVTDEDERVEDAESADTAESVVQNVQQFFPGRSFHAFTMVIQDEACLLRQKQYAKGSQYGTKVSAIAELTQGQSLSLCEEDYRVAFAEMSSLLRSLIEKITLKEKPVLPKTMQVKFIKGAPIPWRLHGQKLIFESPLDPGSQIKVSYWTLKKGEKSS